MTTCIPNGPHCGQERDKAVPDFTNIFHTLHTKLGIIDSERHLVLKYRGVLNRYIYTKIELSTSYPWAWPTDMLSKLSRSSNKRHDNLSLVTPHKKIQERVAPNHRRKDRENMDSIRTTSPSYKQRKTPEIKIKIPGSGANSIRDLGITLMTATQSSR
jgi:hypothetical protein